MKKTHYIIIAFMTVFLQSCGGGGDGPDPIVEVTAPSAASLVFPVNNEECNTGASVSTSQSTVNFQWNIGDNATSSELVVKNLLTNVEATTTSTSNQKEITINKNTPYKWWVISRATGSTETAKSTEWKFYNSGDAITTYAPFPAELVGPTNGSTITTTTVTLEWSGSDVDDDITAYDVYLGTVNPPTTLQETTTNLVKKIENVAVSTNVYYWKVITKDEEGNSSTSQIFEFKVE